MPTNKFKLSILSGQQQLGLWSTLCSANSSEIVAGAGFDWILFDTEHSPIEVADLVPLLRATTGGTAAPVVRPAWNDLVLLKRVLDLGVATVLIPYIQSVEEAHRAVSACKYPPLGTRGVAGNTRSSRYGRDANYLQTANDTTCVLLQLETQTAIDQLSDIAAVAGVDGIFIGPGDLAASMGYLGQPGAAPVQALIKKALALIQAASKPAGILAVTTEDAQRYLDMGFTFVAAGIDSGLLRASADALARGIVKRAVKHGN